MNISVCIATWRRPARLAVLLADLVGQRRPPQQVVVVDNDAAGSARAVVEARRLLGAPFEIVYAIQPQQNIALARNLSVELAGGDWLAFVDDDEQAPPTWLAELAEATRLWVADGALGPVEPVLPASAPDWVVRGGFHRWVRLTSGSVVPPNQLRFGNVLLRASLLRELPQPFDPAYGLTGGEDGDLLARLVQQGARIVWCDEAPVSEPVEPARLRLRWLVLRALRGGQDFARHTLAGRYGRIDGTGRVAFAGRAALQCAAAALLVLPAAVAGRHRAVHWLLKSAANAGKLSVYFGWHYREYAGATA